MALTVFVTSGKGGTGKSTFAVNLALTLAYQGKATALMDMNMGLRDLDLYIGLQDRAVFDLYDVVTRLCEPETALLPSGLTDKLCFLPAHQGPEWQEIGAKDVRELVDHLRDSQDYIIMDGAPGIHQAMEVCLDSSDIVVMVTTPDYAALRDAGATEDYLIQQGITDRRYVLNRMLASTGNRYQPELRKIGEQFRCALLGMIPEDENIRMAANAGTPIVAKRDSYIARNFDRMAERLQEESDSWDG